MQAKTAMRCLCYKNKTPIKKQSKTTFITQLYYKKNKAKLPLLNPSLYQASDPEGVNPCGRLQPKGSSNLVEGRGGWKSKRKHQKTHQNSKKENTKKIAPSLNKELFLLALLSDHGEFFVLFKTPVKIWPSQRVRRHSRSRNWRWLRRF
jgi:hypothetical protein